MHAILTSLGGRQAASLCTLLIQCSGGEMLPHRSKCVCSRSSSLGWLRCRPVMLFRLLLQLRWLPPHSSDCGQGGGATFVCYCASWMAVWLCDKEISLQPPEHNHLFDKSPLVKCLCVYMRSVQTLVFTQHTDGYDIIPTSYTASHLVFATTHLTPLATLLFLPCMVAGAICNGLVCMLYVLSSV